ncbi:protein suppressor of hairy wing-like isoform X1 [Amphibalanus amphitrite]|uniref:protein suppressor of hairy wing-like isoform X1 n=1 Tax=Amphibalanus amphitrite TaxID=1232801 RepID=UPI001C9040A8|nr:protein suppressor of hairy wing-like isoform X1 [Amphibalanus amphitrite]
MNQLRVRYHQLKIDMFALYQATMDSRGVKVHRVEQALGDLPAPGPSHVQLRNEDAAYVQKLSEMEKKITVGEHGRRRRHMLRKLNFSRSSGEPSAGEVVDAAAAAAVEPSTGAESTRHESGCRELDRHSNITVLRCYRCTKRFDDQTSLFAHWRDEINCHIVCLFCREEFITNAKHDQHIRLCQALVCAQCKAQCSDYAEYEQHIAVCLFAAKCEPVEVLAARVQCPYCDRLFTQIHMFKRHLKIMHEVEHMQRFGLKIQRKFRPNEREFPCRQCGRTFNRVYNLKMHQLSHGRNGQYRCETCNKTFRFRSNLERHARSHTAQQHECRVCGQQFRLLRQLRGHMNVAHDKDQFACEICQKSCDGYQRLLTHARTHHTQKAYSCGVCGRVFSTKHKYKEHMNVHDGRYTYECHMCSERFFTRDHLRKHYRKQHPEVKRLPRRATIRRPLDQGRSFYEPTDLGPMINDTVTLYQASADSGDASVVKFEVVGEPCDRQVVQTFTADQTSQEMMDGGYQVYEGSDQHILGEYTPVAEGDGYGTPGACHRTAAGHTVQYFPAQQQVPDGVDGAATLLSLEPASSAEVPEGATVMTYIVPETTSSQFSVQDSTWAGGSLFHFPGLITPEKGAAGGGLYAAAGAPGPSGAPAGSSLFLTPDKAPLAPPSLFTTPERPSGGAGRPPPEAGLLSTPDRGGGGEAGLLYTPAGPAASPLGWPAADRQPELALAHGYPPLVKTEAAAVTEGGSPRYQPPPPPPPLAISSGQGAIFTSPQQAPVFVSSLAE